MRKFDKANVIVVATIVLCFLLTLGACHLFAGEGILSSAFSKDKAGKSFYAVCVGGYSDAVLARSSAELIRLRGGAGYLYTADGADVVVAVYPDQSSADSVAAKLGEKGVFVKEISIDSVSFKWANKSEKSAAEAALGYFNLAFDTLYAQSNSFADKQSSIDDVKLSIKVLYAQIDDIKSQYYKNSENSDKEQITEIKLALVTCLALLDGIKYSGDAALLSSLRCQTVQLVLCYKALCAAV